MAKEIDTLDSTYWSNRFEQKDTPWDLGEASPPLSAYFNQLTNRNLTILIPGCGNAWEANYLLENGFTNITLIDIAPAATRQLDKKFERFRNNLRIITGDFFAFNGQFDLIVEQTFFCALVPSLREKYVKKMAALLAPSGKLAGVLFNRAFEGGPPFGAVKKDYELLFKKHLHLYVMEDCYNSARPRMGTEVFFIAGRKNSENHLPEKEK